MNKSTLVNALSIILDLPKGNKDLEKLPVKTLEAMFNGMNKNFEYLKTLEQEVAKLRFEVKVND